MKTKYLVALLVVGAVAIIEVAVLRTVDIRMAAEGGRGPVAAAPTPSPAELDAAPPAYDITPLIRPSRKYLGVTVDGGADLARIRAFGDAIGKQPNIVGIFESFDDEFAAAEVRRLYRYGALTIIRWEPFDIPMKDIAAGKHDDYVTRFATAVRALNLPVALSFAHEMNGHWYSWGPRQNTAREYVAAWRHLHRIFAKQGATNVLWTWTPNVINYLRQVKLEPLYPGDEFVDWIGMDGYYTVKGLKAYRDLFRPTIVEIRTFTQKPMLIVETGAEPSADRPAQIENLLSNVAKSKDVIGVLYFNLDGSGYWRLDDDTRSLQGFARQAASDAFGFRIQEPA